MLEGLPIPQPVLRVDHDRIRGGARSQLHDGGGSRSPIQNTPIGRLRAKRARRPSAPKLNIHSLLRDTAADLILYCRLGEGKASQRESGPTSHGYPQGGTNGLDFRAGVQRRR